MAVGCGTAIHVERSRAQFLLGPLEFLNAELTPICHLLALLGAHHILHVSRIRVNPPDRTMVLGSFQPLAEISTRGISWR